MTRTEDSCVREHVRRHGFLYHHTLDDAAPVSKEGKEQLAAFAKIVEPALDNNFLALEL